MNNYKEAKQQYDAMAEIARNIFNEMSKTNGLLSCDVATVASYNDATKKARVYFPGDNESASSEYLNLTDKNLVKGQKVYIFHKYKDIEQGWIMA